MELLVFSLFAAALLVCVIFHISLLFALLLDMSFLPCTPSKRAFLSRRCWVCPLRGSGPLKIS